MPGIAGIISDHPIDECQRLVRAMIDCMCYERFYVSDTYFAPEIGVYGGWVAHEGSFAAHHSTNGKGTNLGLLFSGECFSSSCSSHPSGSYQDRRVNDLLKLYDEKGEFFVSQLNGLFSGLLIDRLQRRALLFNDRYGIERIYYYVKDKTTYVASEAKALLKVIPETRAFNDEGVAQFLAFGCTLGKQTLFRNIRLLPGGSLWVFDGFSNTKKQYFIPENWESQLVLSEEAFELEFMETFRKILPRYISSNCPIGISLTGGLDTRMIMACLPESAAKLVCYTFSGLTQETLDVQLAARVAKVCGFEHHVLRIGIDFLENYGHYVDQSIFNTDGCAGALSAHEIYFNEQGRALSKVRLTGNFGSEILRSMSTFKSGFVSNKLINKDFDYLVASTLKKALNNQIHPVSFAAFQEIPWNLFGTLAAGKSQLTFRTPYLDNELVALAYRAPNNSRRSPRAALRLVNESNRNLSRIPTDRGLIYGESGFLNILRRLFSEITFKVDYFHKEGLPSNIFFLDPVIQSLSVFRLLDLHKFLPYRNWFRQQLSAYIYDRVNAAYEQRLPYWNSHILRSIASEHVHGLSNYVFEINAVLNLEAVYRLLIQNVSAPIFKKDINNGDR